MPTNAYVHQPKRVVGNWFRDMILGTVVLQFLLFLSRYFPDLTLFIGRYALWLTGGESVNIDDSYKVFSLDCKV
jgi:L-gulonolactone oxidase